MPVPTQNPAPRRARLSRYFLLAMLLVLIFPAALLAKTPQPTIRIPLDPLGFQPLTQRYLLAGSSMVTVHYVDQTHLLLTFVAHRLIPRTPGDPPTDQDRHIDALLLELPTGKVLARAEWFLHDHGQYLWSLGHGQFLLRTRNTFTVFAPVANLAAGRSFQQTLFLTTNRRVVLASLSADAGLLTIETADPLPEPDPDAEPAVRPAFTAGPPQPKPPAPERRSDIQFNFYRLIPPVSSSSSDAAIIPSTAGTAISRYPAELPISSAGLLHPADQGRQRWAFDFREHQGKITPLAMFDSTCRPAPFFISPSEFVALACRGGDVHQILAGFNLRGEATWQQILPGPFVSPYLAFAPNAGRFAFGRVLVNTIAGSNQSPDPSLFVGQSVDVIQDDSGKTLLHLECTPLVRAGQNFALAPDGMSLAILHDLNIEIYPLPSLDKEDKTAIQLAEKSTLPVTSGNVNVAAFPNTETANSKSARRGNNPPETAGPQLPDQSADAIAAQPSANAPLSTSPSDNQPNSTPATAQPAPAPPDNLTDSPNPPEPVRRKPPTLYNPDAPSPSAPPQSTAPPKP